LPTYPERNEARSKPKVSSFISARYEKIEALQPDLVLQMIRVLAGIVGFEDKDELSLQPSRRAGPDLERRRADDPRASGRRCMLTDWHGRGSRDLRGD
jgi:hypothetical protein